KKQYCCKTCSAPPAPSTTTCAIIYTGTSTVVANAVPGPQFQTVDQTKLPLSKISVNAGCILTLTDTNLVEIP
ncbi:hypothetical protein PMAYCL1PPCAC_10591, partial [Pristionchus mayeri]